MRTRTFGAWAQRGQQKAAPLGLEAEAVAQVATEWPPAQDPFQAQRQGLPASDTERCSLAPFSCPVRPQPPWEHTSC
jgi:hypothetical protein